MSWYYHANDENIGPLSEDEFQKALTEGKITPNTLVWEEGMPEWVKHQDITKTTAIAASEAQGDQNTCVECGNQFPDSELISYDQHRVCGGCKDHFFQRVREGAPLPNDQDSEGTGGETHNRDLMRQSWNLLSRDYWNPFAATIICLAMVIGIQMIPYLGGVIVLFIGMPMRVGRSRYLLKFSRSEPVEVGSVFDGFNQYLTCLVSAFLRTCAFLIPMIIGMIPFIIIAVIFATKNQGGQMQPEQIIMLVFATVFFLVALIPTYFIFYTFFLTEWIIAEQPEIGPIEALQKSKELMSGKRWKLFCLHCRFIGWGLLAVIPCLLGFFFLNPYFQMANTQFYLDAKEPVND